ncbi:hypothetical protein [Kriegella aquimaris]|uniref:OmpA family protein n=1 Tax=Kriegella aquimaris TaxID=192904 RepID=A0A1G9IA07_9FLAO|nr:hypothetical protein [Kriegella aquimaris]SDL21936.1 hypothetical protein SAMN04488514_10149 [Kriegella aquimaris]
MKKTILFILLAVPLFIHAQRKSDLIAEIESIKTYRDSIQNELLSTQRSEKASLARMEAAESQLSELRDANTLLLQNLKMFTEASNKRSSSIGNTLESLKEKEAQLKIIKDEIARNDSTAVVILTNAKQTLGENAKISVNQGAVVISEKLTTLFGDGAKSDVSEAANDLLGKIANILSLNPNISIMIEGLSMTGELDLAIRQAAALGGILQKQFSIAPERITAVSKDGNFTEGINFRLHPQFEKFYLTVRENMKNNH